jgi:hypothetical protein
MKCHQRFMVRQHNLLKIPSNGHLSIAKFLASEFQSTHAMRRKCLLPEQGNPLNQPDRLPGNGLMQAERERFYAADLFRILIHPDPLPGQPLSRLPF